MATVKKVNPLVKAKADLVTAQKAVAARERLFSEESRALQADLDEDMLGLTTNVAMAKAAVEMLGAREAAKKPASAPEKAVPAKPKKRGFLDGLLG